MTISDEGLLDTLFERMPVGIAVFDRDGTIVRLNPTWIEFAADPGASRIEADWVGRSVYEMLPDVQDWADPMAERVYAGETVRMETLRMEVRGRVSYWDATFSPLYEDGEVVGIVEIATEVTDRELTRQELEERVEQRTAEIARRQEVADGLHYILDTLNSCCPEEEVLDFIISEARRLLGSDAISIYRLHVADGVLTMETQRGLEDEAVAALEIPLLGGGHVAQTIMQRKPMVMPDVAPLIETASQQLPPEQTAALRKLLDHYRAILAVPMIVGDEIYGGLTMYYPQPREFTAEEISLAEDLADHLALALENAQLREHAEEIAAAEERSRLARDLHDAVTQTLFSASLIAEVLPQIWERDPEEGRKRLAQLRYLTRGALAEMRTLLLELRPATLDEVPLTDLFRQLAEATHGRSGIEVHVDIATECDLVPDAKLAFYRIAQEALNNIAKHSEAAHASLVLVQRDDMVELVVTDDGRGFDPSGRKPESLGLNIMRERAESVGADLSVDSAPGKGTRVTLTWQGRCKECDCS